MLKKIIQFFFRALITVAHKSYGIEGINALLLIMPAKLIVPTLRKYGASVGEDTVIHSPLTIHNAGNDYRNLRIGSHVYFGREVFLDLKEKITISDRVTLSMRVTVLTHTDVGESDGKKALPPSQAPVLIDSGAYLGANVTVLQGVTVHRGAVVGAASLVLKDIPPQVLAAGHPARVLRNLS